MEIGKLGKAKFILKEGGTLGDLYSQSDLKRDNNGMVEIDPSGALVVENNLDDIKLGTVFPKANLAWNNHFSWKGISLSALITARIGGIVYSATEAAMDQYGVSERSALARQWWCVIEWTYSCRCSDLLYSNRQRERTSTILYLQCYQCTLTGSQSRLHYSTQVVG